MSSQDDNTCLKSYYQLKTPIEASRENKSMNCIVSQNTWYQQPENIQESCQSLLPTPCADLQSCDQKHQCSHQYPVFFNSHYNDTGSISSSPSSSTSSDMFFSGDCFPYPDYMHSDVPDVNNNRLSSMGLYTTPDLNDLLSQANVSECASATDLVDSVDPYPPEMIDCKIKPEEYGVDVYGHWYTYDPKSLREDEHLDLPSQETKPWNVKPYYKENKKGQRSEKLWEFIRGLLLNPKFNPSLAEWVDRNNGLFRFNQSKAVAQLWGNRKNNTNMTYEKLSRAMRYYYSRKILLPVIGKKLVYKFGPNSYGW